VPPSKRDIHHQFYNICDDYKVTENNLIIQEDNKYKIYKIRDTQVMLDSDLAELYGVPTKRLNEQVKRNKDRFPDDFLFQLTQKEFEILISQFAISSWGGQDVLRSKNKDTNLKKQKILRSQIATSNLGWGGKRYPTYVFTEQGVASLSGVLKSKRAIEVNIQVMRAFVSMRRFISNNIEVFARLDTVEKRQTDYQLKTDVNQLKTDNNFKKVFDAIESKILIKKQGIFYDGQVFDAHKFVSDLIRSAKKSIILIDNYIDDSVLILFTKIRKDVTITIYTENITSQLDLDLKKYNLQYSSIEIKILKKAHDRFLIIDRKDVYHFGASIKDLGKKWFAFAKLNKESITILDKLDDN